MCILSLPTQCIHRQLQMGVLVTIKLIHGFSDGNRCFKKTLHSILESILF